jgi:hypothetical protein
MAKRKKQSKAHKKKAATARGKARRAKAAQRTVAKAKPKRAPVKKAARKVKRPVTPVVETVAAEIIEQPAPGVITVTEVEETRQVSWTGGYNGKPKLGTHLGFSHWHLIKS